MLLSTMLLSYMGRRGAGLGVQLIAPRLPPPHPLPFSIAALRALAPLLIPSPPRGVRPRLRSSSDLAAGVRLPSRLGVDGGPIVLLVPRTDRSPILVFSAAALSAPDNPLGVPGVPGAPYARARSDIALLACVPSRRPRSSRFFVSGILKLGRASSGSDESSSARGVASSVPHVISGGRSSGSGSASPSSSNSLLEDEPEIARSTHDSATVLPRVLGARPLSSSSSWMRVFRCEMVGGFVSEAGGRGLVSNGLVYASGGNMSPFIA